MVKRRYMLTILLLKLCINDVITKRWNKIPIDLISGNAKNEGFLSVNLNDKWFSVCNKFWGSRNSKVVCRELGYNKAIFGSKCRTISNEIESRSFFFKEFMCNGNERSLAQCKQRYINEYTALRSCDSLNSIVYIKCSSEKELDDTKLRRMNKRQLRFHPSQTVIKNEEIMTSGFLQIRELNRWNDICVSKWNKEDATDACMELGFPSSEGFSLHDCDGSQLMQQQCKSRGMSTPRCALGRKSIFLNCKQYSKEYLITEENGDVRLRSGSDHGSGRVEIFDGQKWGTICDDGWDINDANVVCKQLGFGAAYEATHWAEHGEGLGNIIFTNVECHGNETNVNKCKSSNATSLCTHSEDAGVRCIIPQKKIQNVIRLRGGRNYYGRIEVLHKKSWFGICGIGFTQREGQVVCRQLGLGFVEWATRSYKYGVTYQKLMYNVQCIGNETSLFDCRYQSYGRCRYYDMASVICSQYAPDVVMDITTFKESIKVESHTLYQLKCSYEEGCLAPIVDTFYGRENYRARHLLKFTSRFVNKGTVSFRPNADKRDWEYHDCHKHYHSMETFAKYDVIDANGSLAANGHKASFCLEDSECANGYRKVYNCTNKGDQGISVNCADNYKNTIDCQWVDITELKEGNYSLRVHVNPLRNVAESDWLNNRAVCEIHYYNKKVEVKNCTTDPCYKESFGGNSFGHCCHFPFIYKNKKHYSCITDGNESPWCSTTLNYDQDGKWGYCDEK